MDSELAGQVEAAEICDILVYGKHFDRELAQDRLTDLGAPSRAALRTRIIDALAKSAGENQIWTRSWLLSSLGRVANGDDSALDTLKARISDRDMEDQWVRYWALEGAVAGSVDTLAELGHIATSDDSDSLPKLLGLAVVSAIESESDARDSVMDALTSDDTDRQWLALRALRVMPVSGTEDAIVTILERDSYGSVNYQAVVALGAEAPDSRQAAETAALALQGLVVGKRNDLMWTEARTRALNGLGRLGVQASAPVLVDALVDGNPATVREAAIALEAVLGADRAVDRVVEAAAGADIVPISAYAQGLRWMQRIAVVERLEQNVVSGHGEAVDAAHELLTELGGMAAFKKLQARTKSMERYADVLEQAEQTVRQQFDNSVADARHGYKIATRMRGQLRPSSAYQAHMLCELEALSRETRPVAIRRS